MATKKKTHSLPFRIARIDSKTLANTEAAWSTMTDQDAFASECTPMFEWAGTHIDYDVGSDHDSCVYGLFGDNNTVSEALVEVVSRQPKRAVKGQTKLLKVITSPQYWAGNSKQDHIVPLFASAISGTIELSKEAGAQIVKLYGRTEGLLSLLHSVRNEIEPHSQKLGIKCSMQGRWLQIEV